MADAERLRAEWDEHLRVAADAGALLPEAASLADRLCAALADGGKLITFGNGGSAADAQHFAGRAARRRSR